MLSGKRAQAGVGFSFGFPVTEPVQTAVGTLNDAALM
jgi:hypothetical protein